MQAEPVSEPLAEEKIEPAVSEPSEPVIEEPKASVEAPKPVGERKWYVIQTFTGQEDKAKNALEQTIKDEHLADRVFQVLVPVGRAEALLGIRDGHAQRHSPDIGRGNRLVRWIFIVRGPAASQQRERN